MRVFQSTQAWRFGVDRSPDDRLRQAFALSPYLGMDTWVCGVDGIGAASLWRTETGGMYWRRIKDLATPDGRRLDSVRFIDRAGGVLICGTSGSKSPVFVSEDDGACWSILAVPRGDRTIFCSAFDGKAIYLGGRYVHRMQLDGRIEKLGAPSPDHDLVFQLHCCNGRHFALVTNTLAIKTPGRDEGPAIFASDDECNTWTLVRSFDESAGVSMKSLSSGAILVGLQGKGQAWRSSDGDTWDLVLQSSDYRPPEQVVRGFWQSDDGTVWAITQHGGYLWRSVDDGRSFSPVLRIASLDSPHCISGAGNRSILIGCGRGFHDGVIGGASIWRISESAVVE